MKKNKIKIGAILLIALSVILIGCNTFSFAHSGRTDANGGHKDNKNKSGLGSYHYHCGGHPAHFLVLYYSCCESHSRASSASGVDGKRNVVEYESQKLGLSTRRVTNEKNVDVTSQMDSVS